jgi:hypothetical protein
MRGFLELPYIIPAGPLADVLLMDVDWSKITAHFPAARIHAEVAAGEDPVFVLSESFRALALLPVLRSLPDKSEGGAVWVPFLVDRGTDDALQPRDDVASELTQGREYSRHGRAHHIPRIVPPF